MNQFAVSKATPKLRREAEMMLRMTLFSQESPLKDGKSLNEERRSLAKRLRKARRKGAVMVYISTLWFLLALAISIEAGKDIHYTHISIC